MRGKGKGKAQVRVGVENVLSHTLLDLVSHTHQRFHNSASASAGRTKSTRRKIGMLCKL